MKLCYPASFQGYEEARRFEHPKSRMVRVAINGELPENIGKVFCEVVSLKFDENLHPVTPAWYGRHCKNGGWVPSSFIYSERNQSSRECKGQKSRENEKAVMICKTREKMVNHHGVNKKRGTRRA